MTATLAPTATDRERYRGTARTLRDNAGIERRAQIEAVADFGAAARRLRESVRGGEAAAPTRPRVAVGRPVDDTADADLRHSRFGARAAELLAVIDAEKVTGAAARSAHPAGSGRLPVRPVRVVRVAG